MTKPYTPFSVNVWRITGEYRSPTEPNGLYVLLQPRQVPSYLISSPLYIGITYIFYPLGIDVSHNNQYSQLQSALQHFQLSLRI